MTEHPNLRCIARLFPLFHIPYPNVIRKCPTEMSPNLLVCENINWCRISSICSFVPTHEELSIHLAFNSQTTCTFANCVTVSLYMQLLCPHYGTSCSVPFVAAHATHPVLEGGSLVGHYGAALRIFVGLSVTQNEQLQKDGST